MKIDKKDLANKGIIIALIAFIGIASYLALEYNRPEITHYGNTYICNEQKVLFRSNIDQCLGVSVNPSDEILANMLLNQRRENVWVLVNPNGTAGVGLSMYDIYKGFTFAGIKTGAVYTEEWPYDTQIPVMSIEDATYDNPIIWLQENQSETSIIVDGPKILVSAETQKDLDAAACKIALTMIQKTQDC